MELNSKSSVVLQCTWRNIQYVMPVTIGRRHHKKVSSVQRLVQTVPHSSACAGGISIKLLAVSFLHSFRIIIFLCAYVCNCVCRPKTDARMSSLLCLSIFLLQNLELLILIRLPGHTTQDPSASTYHHWGYKHFLCAWLLRELRFWSWLQKYLQHHLLPYPLLLPLSHYLSFAFNACVHAFKDRVDITCLWSWEA